MTEAMRLKGIVACIASSTAVTVTMGVTLPFLALVLDRQGVPPWLNGLSAAVQMLAVMVLAFVGPRLMARFGTPRVVGTGLVLVALSLLLLPLFPNVWAWFPIRFLLGLSAEMVWTAGDIWINQLATDRRRGRIIGITGFFQHGGFAVGPLLLVALGSATWLPLYIGTAIVLVGVLPLALARGTAPIPEGDARARILHFLAIAPSLLVAGFMFGLIDSATLSLLPVYGLRKGLDADMATALLSFFVVGAFAAQIPLGWLTDHVAPRRVMAWLTALTLAMLLVLPVTVTDPVLVYPVLVLMGAGLGSFYTVALSAMGRRFRGGELVGVTTSFMFLWALGSLIGPAISGMAIELAGPDGMPVAAATLTLGFLVLLIMRGRKAGQPAG